MSPIRHGGLRLGMVVYNVSPIRHVSWFMMGPCEGLKRAPLNLKLKLKLD